MATWKYTLQRGKGMARKDVVIAAGAAEAQSDTLSLNVDRTLLTKGEAVHMIEAIRDQVIASKWPAA